MVILLYTYHDYKGLAVGHFSLFLGVGGSVFNF